jgi:DNA polymerase-3 subunit alpha
VGESAAIIIIEERDANGPYNNFYDFVYRLVETNINKRVIEALIKTGAFDSFGIDRNQLLQNLSTSIAEAQSQKNNEAGGQIGLFQGLEDAYGNTTLKNDPKGSPMAKVDKLKYEKELLGIYLSGHPLDQLRGLVQVIDSFHSEKEIADVTDRKPFRISGVVNGLNVRYTRKDNKKMATFSLNKKTKNYEMIIFSDAFAKYSDVLEEGRTVIIQGVIQKKDDEVQLYAYEVHDLNTSISNFIHKVNFILQPNESTSEFIKLLRTTADDRYGNTKIGVNFLVNDHIIETKTADSLTFNLNPETYSEIKSHPSLAGINAHSVPVKDFDPSRRWKKR